MTKEELAAKLNGREYLHEITWEEERDAYENRLVVIFGYSDDLMEFRGAINDEVGGTDTIYLTPTGFLENKCDKDDCPYFQDAIDEAAKKGNFINGIWDRYGYSWVYETAMPYATFDIMDDGEKCCRGIVVELPKE